MIISNLDLNIKEFEKIIGSLTDHLNSEIFLRNNLNISKNINHNQLEVIIFKELELISRETIFESTFERVKPHEFPDFVSLNTKLGIELKQTKDNKWSSIGSSIMESTRISGIDHIYLLFAKLGTPLEFRCKKYEDCLEDVVVTHSPRYKINMNLKSNDTIFSKIQLNYNQFRISKNPFDYIKKYHKEINPDGASWYISNKEDDEIVFDSIIKTWNTIDKSDQNKILSEIFILFPEIFSKSNKKFDRVTTWIVAKYGIVIPNVRDLFTAGGKKIIELNDNNKLKLPKIFFVFINLRKQIDFQLKQIDVDEVAEIWNYEKNISRNDIKNIWKDKIVLAINHFTKTHNFNPQNFVEYYFKYEK